MGMDALAWQQKKEHDLLDPLLRLFHGDCTRRWPSNWNRNMMAIPIGNYGRQF